MQHMSNGLGVNNDDPKEPADEQAPMTIPETPQDTENTETDGDDGLEPEDGGDEVDPDEVDGEDAGVVDESDNVPE